MYEILPGMMSLGPRHLDASVKEVVGDIGEVVNLTSHPQVTVLSRKHKGGNRTNGKRRFLVKRNRKN